jgi:hypothetical protein
MPSVHALLVRRSQPVRSICDQSYDPAYRFHPFGALSCPAPIHRALLCDQHGVVALLKQMSSRMEVTLNRARVPSGDAQHQPPERCITHLDEKVNVIGHQTVGMESCRESFYHLCGEFIEEVSIGGSEENIPSVIATQSDVVWVNHSLRSERTEHV